MLSESNSEANIFNTRDIEGNESPYTSSASEFSTDDESRDSPQGIDSDMDIDSEDNEQDADVLQKVLSVLQHMDHTKIKLADFLDALSWGNKACVQDAKVRSERTVLLHSPKLSAILNRWAIPPRSKGSKNRRAEGASTIIHDFAVQFVAREVSTELEDLAPELHSSSLDSVDIRRETLVSTSFRNLAAAMEPKAPILWKMLVRLTSRPGIQRANTSESKNPLKA